MNEAPLLALDVSHIPGELIQFDQWVVWRLENRGGHSTKVPYAPRRGSRASVSDPGTWASFGEAMGAYQEAEGKLSGIGFVLSGDDGIGGVDIDHVRDPVTGELHPEAKALIERFSSYTEISPSGTGIRIFGHAPCLPKGRAGIYRGIKVECYSAGRYLTVTGQQLNGCDQLSAIGDTLADVAQSLAAPSTALQFSEHAEGSSGGMPTTELSGADKYAELIRRILSGDVYHDSLRDLAAAMAAQGMGRPAIIAHLQALMQQATTSHDGRWQARFAEIPTLVASALDKFAPEVAETLTREQLAMMIDGAEEFDELTGQLANLVTIARLRDTEKTVLRKQIAKKAGVRIKDLESDAHIFEETKADKDFLHLQAARETIRSFGADNLLYVQAWFWQWDAAGIWRKLAEKERVKQHIHWVAESKELTDSIVNSIYGLCKTEAFRPDIQFDQNGENVINCLSGELILEDGHWQLTPHEREHYRITQIPVAYEPEARAPRFEQFLEEVFVGDHDAPDKCRLVCELLGYSLLATSRFERFVILIGKGANGKSVLLRVVKALVGDGNCAAVQPAEFDNRFQRAHLHGKLANIVSEVEQGAIIPDAALKAIVSGESMTAEHKFCDPFDFSPYATCWFGTNHMPGTRDFSDALFRRAVTIEFNRQFAEHERDVQLASKLLNELPGILNLALKAIAGVIERGAFTRSESCESTKAQWRNENDQAAQFVEECCTPIVGHWTVSAVIYRRYGEWTKEAGIQRPLNRKNFSTRLAALGYPNGKGTGGERRIFGLMLGPRHVD